MKPEYIQKLKSLPTYVPSEETLAKRRALPSPDDLPQITVAELAKHNGKNAPEYPARVAVLGYVIDSSSWFGSHKGRDITTRMIHQVINDIRTMGFLIRT